uniref:Secreted protein n=2 Tax=Wuchereria bancrofti TaxID=6293 RepID=A0A1I8ELV7_WUCBA
MRYMMWLSLFSTFYLLLIKQAIGKILNRKISVPDNDKTLQQILYRSGTLYTNSKLPNSETNWWIPIPGQSLKATVVRTYNRQTAQYYATYNFFQTNARSLCNKNTVALSSLKTCQLETPITQQQECNIVFAWTENEWSTTEIEGTCDIRSIIRNQMKPFQNY